MTLLFEYKGFCFRMEIEAATLATILQITIWTIQYLR